MPAAQTANLARLSMVRPPQVAGYLERPGRRLLASEYCRDTYDEDAATGRLDVQCFYYVKSLFLADATIENDMSAPNRGSPCYHYVTDSEIVHVSGNKWLFLVGNYNNFII